MQWLIGGALLLMREHFRSFLEEPGPADRRECGDFDGCRSSGNGTRLSLAICADTTGGDAAACLKEWRWASMRRESRMQDGRQQRWC
jgi:hypothetical protein